MNLTTKDDWLIVEQRRDPELNKTIKDLQSSKKSSTEFELKDNILHYKTEVNGKMRLVKVVPQSYQWSLINTYHEALKHMGWEKTLAKLKESFWFPKMTSTVRYFVEHCVICRTMKGPSGALQSRLHPIEKVPEPFHTIDIDISGKLSGEATQKEYVFVAIDAYTKFVVLQHAKSKTQSSALKHLQEVIFLFGAPKRIIVDGDGAFTSHYKAYCDQYGIELHKCAGYTSRGNGQVERVMRIIKNGLTVIKHTQKAHWEKSLGTLQLAINCTISKSTGKSTNTNRVIDWQKRVCTSSTA
ncbi:jg7962 [Pararge aegeria aegeria]|uniref:RNA-directed DNA polymerase n=1 Tax=Pararge aegeria aegeria TaxID=348720 RepID=A0A8S4SK52_9NEOP|nr:jg7962 [Pararge aegeria aegeria]